MAWRDSRRSRSRLLLYASSIILGVAALVAVGSLGANLQEAIEGQAKTLLGADLALVSNEPFCRCHQSRRPNWRRASARSQFHFHGLLPETGGTRLAQVRALEGGFPFYGPLRRPEKAAAEFRSGPGALVDGSLMKQFDAQPETDQSWRTVFRICGSLQKVPGEMAAFGALAPRVFIPFADLAPTGLLQKGSLVRHRSISDSALRSKCSA